MHNVMHKNVFNVMKEKTVENAMIQIFITGIGYEY